MDERMRFVADYLSGGLRMTELCRRYGVSRPTGYPFGQAIRAGGAAGVAPFAAAAHGVRKRSRRRVDAIVALRQRHPDWGPVKLIDALRLRAPARPAGAENGGRAAQSAGSDAERRRPAPRRRGAPDDGDGHAECGVDDRFQRGVSHAGCGVVLSADGDGRLQSVSAGVSRAALDGDWPTRAVLTRVFREYGLPTRIRSDNGVPFAGPTSLARLSRLSVWWIRLGIVPELIQPGCPAQNGRHERMHRTLKRGTARPPAGNRAAQQRRFAACRREYNEERPHAALGAVRPRWSICPHRACSPRRSPR